MARRPRVFIPGFPHHVVQRGHNRQAVFVELADYAYYLANLIEWKAQYDVAVYAWCLMTNHVHLVLSPRTEGSAISALMRRVAARGSLPAPGRLSLEQLPAEGGACKR